jgi:hypothetical protein
MEPHRVIVLTTRAPSTPPSEQLAIMRKPVDSEELSRLISDRIARRPGAA